MKISVIGAGYVGLTTALVLAELGNHVCCLDKNELRITDLSNGEIPIYEPGLKELLVHNYSRLTFTADSKKAIEISDVLMIAVGTPSLPDGSTDLRYIKSVIDDLSNFISSYKTIITKSTVPPGTNNLIVNSLLERGVNRSHFRVVSNPEFLREGTAVYDMMHPDKTVIGLEDDDRESLEVMKELYKGMNAPFIVTSLNGAEMIKYANNAFLATKISFINELSRICDALNVNIETVAEGIGSDPRIGPKFLQAGIGYGGSCFPKDLKALQYVASTYGIETRILDSVQHVNNTQIEFYVDKLRSTLDDLKNKKITVLGVTFKPDTDDTRDSPAVKLINAIACHGCDVHIYDPKASTSDLNHINITLHSTIDTSYIDSDCVIIATDWDEFLSLDWKLVKDKMRGSILLDGRNCLDIKKISELGFTYIGLGRV